MSRIYDFFSRDTKISFPNFVNIGLSQPLFVSFRLFYFVIEIEIEKAWMSNPGPSYVGLHGSTELLRPPKLSNDTTT